MVLGDHEKKDWLYGKEVNHVEREKKYFEVERVQFQVLAVTHSSNIVFSRQIRELS